MPVRIESQAEPIPGYKLIERLGGGGFGEVWKAEAPGGLLKAIKFVFGDLHALDDGEDGSRARQELKALNRVTTVHHPYILSLECVHIVDGQLIIVMELADRTLYDRFRECHKQGLIGIPRDELLGYMEETAEALDLMNDHYKLQHLDIKPQNLFLVFNHVKVADFGLVKDLEGMQATVTGGVTPVYAAPETFDGWVSCASDQYSLAIVYQELLTGQRPFSGGTIRQLVLQHMQGTPDLTPLILADRPIVSRALSKNPEHRFPTCLEFVRSLRQAVAPGTASPAPVAMDSIPLPNTELKKAPPAANEPDPSVTCNVRGRLGGVNAAPSARPDSVKLPAAPMPMAPLPPRPPRPKLSEKLPDKPPTTSPVLSSSFNTPGASAGESSSISYPAPVSVPFSESGILRPALIIGVGRVGVDALRQLRKELTEQFGPPEATPHLRLLAIDTDPEAMQASVRGDDGLQPAEVALTRLHRPGHYLKPRDGKQPYASWLPAKLLYAIPRDQNFAGARALGRLALVDNYRAISQKMNQELATASAPETLQAAALASGLEARTRCPRVFIVAGLAGGTGGGMFIDLAYLSRRLLRQQGFKDAEVVGLLCLPPSAATPGGENGAKALVNAHASLAELSHFASADNAFSARYEQRDGTAEKPLQDKGAPFQRCVFFALPDKRGAAPAPPGVSQYLRCDLMTTAGQEVDRAARRTASSLDAGPINHQTIGMYRLVSPRSAIRRQAAQRLGVRLVAHWMSKDATALKEPTQPWVQEQWENLGFRPESMIERHHQKTEAILGHKPETLWSKIINPLADELRNTAGSKDDPILRWTPVVQVVEGLEKLLGIPAEFQGPGSGGSGEPAVVEKALRQTGEGIAAELEQMLAELIVRLFEEPPFRMAGAEEAIRQFSGCIQKALESQEPLLRELQTQTAALYKHIHVVLESPMPANTPHSRWRTPFTRRPNQDQTHSTPELLDLFRAFAKSRYHTLVMQSLNSVYVCLRGLLSDQMREISFCRQRLTELADLVGHAPADKAPSAQRTLLPPGCNTVQDAVAQLDAAIGQPELLAFDAEMQEVITKQYRALVNVCMASTTVIRDLAKVMAQHAETFLEERLEGADAAALLLSQYADDADGRSRLSADLLQAYQESAPPIGPNTDDNELFVISAPTSEAGDRLRELARQFFPRALLVTNSRPDEIVFLRQFQSLSLGDFDQFGPEAQEAYRQRLAQDPAFVHSRTDIEWETAEPVA